MTKLYYNYWAGYFKQGDDLSNHLESKSNNTGVEVFESYKLQLEENVKNLELLINDLKEFHPNITKDEIDACTHHICLQLSESELTKKIKSGSTKYGLHYEESINNEELCEELI